MAKSDRIPTPVWALTVILLVAAVCVLLWRLRAGEPDTVTRVVEAVKELEDPTGAVPLDGAPSLDVIVVFKYTDCPPCLRALGAVQAASDGFLASPGGQELGGLAVGSGYTTEEAEHVARVHGWGFPVLGDPEGRVLEALEGSSTPLVLLVREGQRLQTLFRQGPAMTEVEQEALRVALGRVLHEIAEGQI